MTYIEDDEEYEINAVEQNEDAEEPPVGAAGEQKREAAAGVVEEELELLPDAATVGDAL